MPTAIILGLPKPQADRIKGELKTQGQAWCEGWFVHFIPPTGAQAQIREADIRVALQTASQIDDSVHVLAIANQGGGHNQEIAAHFVPYFRFRRLPGQWLELPYPLPDGFIAKVNEIFADEDDWRASVQPKSIDEALLLPETTFLTKLSDLWGLALKYGEGCNAGCAKRKHEFKRKHYKPHTSKSHYRDYFWTDDNGRIFDHTQEQHGEAPKLRQWKYSFRLPKGFHYDVRHESGSKFVVAGATRSEAVKTDGYANIDPHGCFRDGCDATAC